MPDIQPNESPLEPSLCRPRFAMPLARRKKVLITKDDAALSDPASAVYYIPQTGEIFADYR